MQIKQKKGLRYVLTLIIALISIIVVINNTTSVLRLFYPIKYKEYVIKYSEEYKLDPLLVFAIIKAESSFDPNAISRKNARGLMQISERTGKWGAESLKIDEYSLERLYDPETNIRIGCWYVNVLMKQFNRDMELVLAAYNGGSGKVSEWLRDSKYSTSGRDLDIIPFKETEKYVKRVNNYYFTYKNLYEK